MSSSFSILKIITEGKAATRFLAASLVSFAFSIAVILSTIGLMDGFENTLRTSLKKSSGDFQITSRDGFFLFQTASEKVPERLLAPVLEVEAFAVYNEQNKGVLVKGISPEPFEQITRLEIGKLDKSAAIGAELASALGLSLGDEILLTFASNQTRDLGGAIIKKYKVSAILSHGIYEKDMRFVYVSLEELAAVLGLREGAVNKALAAKDPQLEFDASLAALELKLGEPFRVEPFWSEYRTLLKAVEVEKTSISLVLQIIVVVAIFNVVAFIIFVSEKKSQEFFLLRAFGVSLKQISRFWRSLLFGMWLASAILSLGLTWLFNLLLTNLPVFNLPGDIYVLSNLGLELGWEDFLLVFSLALAWVMLIGSATMWRLRKRAVLTGLRQEFK